MVVIRLARGGAKKKPFYHVVIADRRNARDGRYIERVGIFNPVARGADIYLRLNQERIAHWLKLGAQASDRVVQLVEQFAKTGEITGAVYTATRPVRKLKEPVAEAAANASEAA
jgi:small subunit ribosomal protein S16